MPIIQNIYWYDSPKPPTVSDPNIISKGATITAPLDIAPIQPIAVLLMWVGIISRGIIVVAVVKIVNQKIPITPPIITRIKSKLFGNSPTINTVGHENKAPKSKDPVPAR